jgi:hypothetical protein
MVSGIMSGRNPNPLENVAVNMHLLLFCIARDILDVDA